MTKNETTRQYTAVELKARRGESLTDWRKVDEAGEEELERLIAEDEAELGLDPDWARAELILPQPKQSIHLRLEREVIEFFRSQGKGHIARMQAVLKTYADEHRRPVK